MRRAIAQDRHAALLPVIQTTRTTGNRAAYAVPSSQRFANVEFFSSNRRYRTDPFADLGIGPAKKTLIEHIPLGRHHHFVAVRVSLHDWPDALSLATQHQKRQLHRK